MTPTDAGSRAHRTPRTAFFLGLAMALTLALFIGFSRSFFLHPVFDAKPLTLPLIVHGLCGSAWFLLLIAQAWLARGGRIAEHRRVGRWGPIVAVAVVLSALWIVAITAFDGKLTGSGLPEHVGLFIQLTTTGWFALLAAAGFARTRAPDAHRRLMLFATIAMMAPAFSRISRLFRDAGPPAFDSSMFAIPFILAIAWYDWRRLGRLHPVTLWVGGAYLVWTQVRMPLARSEAWAALVIPWLGGG